MPSQVEPHGEMVNVEPGLTSVSPDHMYRAFRLALDPTAGQIADLERFVGASRWAYNYALALKVAAHRDWRARVASLVEAGISEVDARSQMKAAIPTKFEISRLFNQLKGDSRADQDGVCPWWHEVSAHCFESAFADVDVAWGNWLASLKGERSGRTVGYPNFKKKGRCRKSVRLRGRIRLLDYRHLRVPRIGSIRLHQSGKRLHRQLALTGGSIQSVTLSNGASRWFASVLIKEPAMPESHANRTQRSAGLVGVDLGISRLATLSTGEFYANPRHMVANQRRLKRAQQALSRTQKGSNRRKKAAARVAKVHQRVAEHRSTTLHQITKQLATRYEAVAIEDLNVAGMTRSARGTVVKPGRNVRAKAGLNRALMDAGFGEFRRQLNYKTRWYGSRLVVVDRFYPSSKTCSKCGAIKTELALSERTYVCASCGAVMDRDENAAVNIAAFAREVQ